MTIGEFLAENRRKQGKSIRDVEKATKIGAKYIEAIENDNFDQFSAPVYAKGFIRNYAEFLTLDPIPLIRQFNVENDSLPRAEHASGYDVMDIGRDPGLLRKLGYLAGAVAIVIILLTWMFGSMLGRSEQDATIETTTTVAAVPVPAANASVPITVAQPFMVSFTAVAERGAWLKVTSDGKKVFEDVLARGKTMDFKASTSLSVVVGNSSGLTVKVNGKDLGVFDKASPGATERTFSSADIK